MSDFENIGDDQNYLHRLPQKDNGFEYDYERILKSMLDGQEYHPAPKVVEDTRTGFDMSGDYHCIPDVSGNDLAYTRMTMPYMIAVNLQAEVVRQCEMNDYTVSETERHDIAMDIVNEWSEQNAFDPIDLAFEGLNHWRRMYLRRD